MQFRISHLFVATLIIAVFAYGMAFPTYLTARWFVFGMVMASLLFIVRAICAGLRERKIIASGMLVAVGYHVALRYHYLPTRAMFDRIRPPYADGRLQLTQDQMMAIQSSAENFAQIGQFAFAVVFGLAAAVIAAYWTRQPDAVD